MEESPETRAYINARVFTCDPDLPEAEAFSVSDGRFSSVGSASEVLAAAGSGADRVDLGSAAVIPGLVDAHVHLIDYGLMLQNTADLGGCRSVDELQERLRIHAQSRPGKWVFGHGFDHELFDTRAFPTREQLDEVSRDRPVVITRLCGHAAVGNTRAFDLATRPIPAEGRATGLLTEDDTGALFDAAPEPSDEEIDAAIRLAGEEALSLGLTGVHCLLSDMRQLDRLQAINAEGDLPIRFVAQIPFSRLEDAVARGLRTGAGDDWLTVGALKVFSDGSLGARTAAMLEDYSDDSGNRGLLLIDREQLAVMIRKAESAGFQTAIHAIGDAAVEAAVFAIEDACSGENTMRHRIEHASQLTRKALETMARLRIPAAVQPQFVLTDFWTRERVGLERYRWSYCFKTMRQAGIPLAMSSDCYVERLDPYELLYRAWVRDDLSAAEALTPAESICDYSLGSAWASHQERTRGSISAGKLADAVIFERSPLDSTPDELLKLRPSQMMVGGRLHRP